MLAILRSISINTAIANFIIFQIINCKQITLSNDYYSIEVYEIMFVIVFVKFVFTRCKYKNVSVLFSIIFVTFYFLNYFLYEILLGVDDFSLNLDEIKFLFLYFALIILAHYIITVLKRLCIKIIKVLYSMKYMLNYFFIHLNFSRIKNQ